MKIYENIILYNPSLFYMDLYTQINKNCFISNVHHTSIYFKKRECDNIKYKKMFEKCIYTSPIINIRCKSKTLTLDKQHFSRCERQNIGIIGVQDNDVLKWFFMRKHETAWQSAIMVDLYFKIKKNKVLCRLPSCGCVFLYIM
jgi:hypothetical protein